MRSFALAFVLGALALQQQASLPELNLALPGMALLLAAALPGDRRPMSRAFLLAGAGVLLGFAYAAWRADHRLADALPFAMEGRDVEIVGVVAGLPQPGETGTRFAFEVE